jgi:enoyl-CoA hydratase/carnithine racemase
VTGAAGPIVVGERSVEGVVPVRLNRPDVFNAIDRAVMEGLGDALERVASDLTVRCIVLTGTGGAFCSGADLGLDTGGLDDAEARRMLDAAGRVVTTITAMPVPVVAAVNGPAAGVGASIALACDLVLAAKSAYFLLPFLSVGLLPDGGTTGPGAAALGRARATRRALRRERLMATAALDAGLIAPVCAPEDLDATAREWATDLATGPRKAIAATKAAINAATLAGLPAALARESADQRRLLLEADFAEGVAAFRDRRIPDFAP